MKNDKTVVFEELIKNLGLEGSLVDISETEKKTLICSIEKDVENYRIMNYKKIIESQEEISSFVLTS